MPFVRAGQLARWTPSARADDALGLVAENLREANCGAIPVLDEVFFDDSYLSHEFAADGKWPRVLGIIDERDLGRAVLPLLETHESARREEIFNPAATEISVETPPSTWGQAEIPLLARDIMRPNLGVIPSQFSLHNTLLTLERYDASSLPVIDDNGRFRGMVSRADVIAALGQQVRPPSVGGMATPLGVWLTTGSVSGGAPTLGLFLSGAILGACFVGSDAIMQGVLSILNEDWGRLFASGRLGMAAEGGDFFNLLIMVLQGFLFLGLMRMLPLAGIHAAEHQTVWAIEKGVALTPENVAKMPRAHPRCGTNLMALSGLILVIFGHLPSFDPTSIMFALIFIYFAWRSVGTALQNYLTTKPATPAQLASGIKAGREVMEKYQSQPHVAQSFALRLFNSGLIWSFGGFLLVQLAYQQLRLLFALHFGG